MFPKIILTTGCSYGRFASSFEDWLYQEKIELPGVELVIDLHATSTGAKYQTLSIIESVEKLIASNVDPKDIFVLAEYSQILRKDVLITDKTMVEYIDNIIFEEKISDKIGDRMIKMEPILFPKMIDFKENELTKSIINFLQEKKFFAPTFPKLNNYYVANFENITYDFPNKTINNIIKFYSQKEVKSEFFFIDRAIDYFQNIFTVQEYLKSKGIKYKFCLINNQFSMFNMENLFQYELKTKVIDGEHYLYQDYLNSNQIWEINSNIKTLYDMIDWTNWWFYENKDKNIVWGGIDEYAIEKFGIKSFPSRNKDTNLFGQHPNKEVYSDLIKNELMKEYFLS
jgi:hypothetical protein